MPRESKADAAWRRRVARATEELLESGRAVRYGPEGEEHFCRPDELLLTRAAADALAEALQELGAWRDADDARGDGADRRPDGAAAAGAVGDVERWRLPAGTDVHEVVLGLRKQAGPAASGVGPNALLFGAPKIRGCPGRPPARAADLDLPEGKGGEGVLLAVVDTGLAEEAQGIPWVAAHVRTGADALDALDGDGDGRLDLEAGHGTFIAGVVAQVAPAVELLVLRALEPDGSTDDLTAARQVEVALDEGAQVVNLSFGGYTHSDAGLVALTAVLDRAEEQGAVVVAAAGNDAVDRPFHPAADERVIAVAALGTRKRRAAFSNFGPWVDAGAEGERLHSCYVTGRATTDADGDGSDDEFTVAAALWSGTSFAAPQVAAAIARRMSEHGESARDAADALVRDPALPRRAGTGVHVVTPLRGRPARVP